MSKFTLKRTAFAPVLCRICGIFRIFRTQNNGNIALFSSEFRSNADIANVLRRVYESQASPLKLELDNEESREQGTLIPRIDPQHIGMASLLGRRETNEDRLLTCKLSQHHLVAGIFDGHGGPAAADFAKAVLPTCLHSHLLHLWNDPRRHGESLRNAKPQAFESLLTLAFLQVNNLMARHFFHYATARERHWSGTTATVVLLRHGQQLIVSHVGDSRAILYRSGQIYSLTVDHVPDSLDDRFFSANDGLSSKEPPTEVDRILACGGTVRTNSLGVPLVNGRLGMTRSLGDLPLKTFGVIARPHVTSIKIRHSSTSFLAIVSDGISHVMSDQEIVQSITSCRTPNVAANHLVENALHCGSEDNASALVIPFGAWGKFTSSPHQRSFGGISLRIKSDYA